MIVLENQKKVKVCSKKDCPKAGSPQSLDKFYKDKSAKDGLRYRCKSCMDVCKKIYVQENKEKIKDQKKIYAQENKEKIREYNKVYRQENKEAIKECNKTYKQKNKERLKEYNQFHAKEIKQYHRQYTRDKRKTDINFRLADNLRRRLHDAIKQGWKSGSAVADLMMSISDFKLYLEERFYPNPETGEMMTWNNYGMFGWHIDHIVPLSAFDLTDPQQFKKACHYSNLRPMWAKQNISEGDRGLSLSKREKRI